MLLQNILPLIDGTLIEQAEKQGIIKDFSANAKEVYCLSGSIFTKGGYLTIWLDATNNKYQVTSLSDNLIGLNLTNRDN